MSAQIHALPLPEMKTRYYGAYQVAPAGNHITLIRTRLGSTEVLHRARSYAACHEALLELIVGTLAGLSDHEFSREKEIERLIDLQGLAAQLRKQMRLHPAVELPHLLEAGWEPTSSERPLLGRE